MNSNLSTAAFVCALLLACVDHAPVPASSLSARQSPQTSPATKPKDEKKVLQTYVGRYEVPSGVIPITTLDVSFDGKELWVKPSLYAKRKLIRQSRTEFADANDGSKFSFITNKAGKVESLTFTYGGQFYTATKIMLPPPSIKGNSSFRLKGYADASVVALAGSFNNWQQSQTLCARDGDEWICRIELQPGKYAYKFIVDGNWIVDPSNPNIEDDGNGNLNSILVVQDEPRP